MVRALLYAFVYAVAGFPLAVTGAVLVLAGLLLGGVLSVTALGPWLLALTVRGALGLGAVQRRLVRVLLDVRVEAPAPRAGAEPGAFGWRRAVLGDRAGWRAVGCALAAPLTAALPLAAALAGYVYGALFVLGPLVGAGEARVVTALAGLALLAAAPWLVRRSLAPHRALLAALLAEDPADRRIRALEETRAQAVEDAAATLRRIERDLHDGTQARLVGLGMHLTLVRELITAGADEERLLGVVDTARANATQAVAELRAVVKGIHPPVLDQGLDAALATLAADAPLPVAVTVELARRPSPALESLVYFCAAELLANAVKHSGASAVAVDVRGTDGELSLAVTDDGRGGAAPGAGSGLTGLGNRARTVDGALTCDSPPGGPTVVTVSVPY
ncbi:sensor domain-containing protein [Streptomyces sp. NPDC057116]|uniref:sensor histidine kinase n=1 Tax=Streptomyces sp. NPDC057116 TaxID=3346023 RepID=UPI00362AA0BA